MPTMAQAFCACLALLIAAAILASCGSTPAASPKSGASPAPGEWPMYGGAPGRTNAGPPAAAPPFERAWERGTGAGFGPASVAIADGTVLVATLTGEVLAIDLTTGEERHSDDAGEAIFGTPLAAGGNIFVGLSISGENLVAYDAATWERRWAVETGDIESSLLLVKGAIIATLVDGAVAAYDTADGKERWVVPFAHTRGRPASRSAPSSDGERIFACTDEGGLVALGAADGAVLWEAHAGGPVFGTVPVSDGRVFVATRTGTLRAFAASSGAVLWTADAGSPVYGAPAVDASTVVVGTSAGELRAFRTADGSLLWTARCAGGVGGAPLISGGLVFAGDLGSQVAAFDLTTGVGVWKENVGGRVRATPVAVGGKLVVLAEDDRVICFRPAGSGVPADIAKPPGGSGR